MMNTTERTTATETAPEYENDYATETVTAPDYATKARPHWTATAFKIVGVTLFALAVAAAVVGLYATGGSFTLPQLSW